MAKTILEQAKELLKAAQENPGKLEEFQKALKKQDAHMGGQGSVGPDAGAGAGNVVKDEVMPGGNQTAPSMSGPTNTTGKAEAGETKHARCVEHVEAAARKKGKKIANPHAVCVAQGVKPGNWKKSEDVEIALGEHWVPRFISAYEFESLNKAFPTGAPASPKPPGQGPMAPKGMPKPTGKQLPGMGNQKPMGQPKPPGMGAPSPAMKDEKNPMEKAKIQEFPSGKTLAHLPSQPTPRQSLHGRTTSSNSSIKGSIMPGTAQHTTNQETQHPRTFAQAPRPSAWRRLLGKDEKNPDQSADAKLGEQVEHDVENHFKQNRTAEAKEGHSLTAKQEMGVKTAGHKHKVPKPVSTSTGLKNTGLDKQAPVDKCGLTKDWIKSEEVAKALNDDWKPRYRK